MKPTAGNYFDLHTAHDKACARLAAIAQGDTIHGGARAMVIAKRGTFLEEFPFHKLPDSVPADEIVSDVYSQSTGRTSEQWGAWECNECGQTHLGFEKAAQCCSQEEDTEWESELRREIEDR